MAYWGRGGRGGGAVEVVGGVGVAVSPQSGEYGGWGLAATGGDVDH